MAALKFALKSHRTQTCAVNIGSFSVLGKFFPPILPYLDERVLKAASRAGAGGPTSPSNQSEQFWKLYDSKGTDLGAKLQVVQEMLQNILGNILKHDSTDVIPLTQDFQEMGVDSLMFVEMKNSLQVLLGDRITVTASALRECNTVDLLSAKLIGLIEQNGSLAEEPSQPPSMEEVASLIREDGELPQHIHPRPGQSSVAERDIGCVLLTGSTGTLGPYLLKELTRRVHIARVICLIRPTAKMSAYRRLENVLKERDLLQEVDMTKVSTVVGDVASAQLGLEPGAWEELSNKVDAIVHCAASVQHVEHYRKQERKGSIRQVNVQGVKNILEFSCSGAKLKHVFHTSTFFAVPKVDRDGVLHEDWPEIGDFDGLTTAAYPITKFLGELLLKQGIRRGIPGKALRFPIIAGDSRTGRFLLQGNHFMLRYLFILKTGVMPSLPTPMQMIPVDTCAKLGVQLYLDESWKNDIINLLHDRPDLDQDFKQLAQKLGYNVDIVQFSEFTQKLRDSTVADSPFAIFKELYSNDKEFLGMLTAVPAIKQWLLSADNGIDDGRFFSSMKLLKLIPDFYGGLESSMDCVQRDLLFARGQGWLHQYGLK